MKLRVASSLISPVVSSRFEAQLPMKIWGRLGLSHHDTPPAGGNVNLLAEERLKGRKSLTEE
jgi:hypothetical protein